MLIYFITVLLIFLVSILNIKINIVNKRMLSKKKELIFKDNRNLLIWIFCLSLIFLLGFRNDGGADDIAYQLFYESGYGSTAIYGILTGKEPVFLLLAKLARLLGGNYKLLFLLYAIFTSLFIGMAIKNFSISKRDTMVFMLGFFAVVFCVIMTVMRQALAMSIIFYYYSIKNPTKKWTIILFCLAFLCHYASVIVLGIEIVRKIVSNRGWINSYLKILIPIFCIFLGYIINFSAIFQWTIKITGMYSYMNSIENYTGGNNVGIFTFMLFVGYLIKIWLNRGYKTYAMAPQFVVIEELQMIYFSLVFLTENLRWGNRVQIFYIIFVPFVFIELLNIVRLKQKTGIYIMTGIMLIVCFVYILTQNIDILEAKRSLMFWK